MWPFTKKKDDIAALEKELGLGNEEGLGLSQEEKPTEEYDRLGGPSFAERRASLEMPSGPTSPLTQPLQPQPVQTSTDIQLISAKLDTIKAMLETLNQRLLTLERALEEKPKQQLVWR